MNKIGVLIVVAFVAPAVQAQTHVTVTPEVRLTTITKAFHYTKAEQRDVGLESSGTEYQSLPMGVTTLVVARGRFSTVLELSAGSMHSTHDFSETHGVRILSMPERETNGLAIGGEASVRYAPIRWLDLGVGYHRTQINDHTDNTWQAGVGRSARMIPVRDAFVNVYQSPLIGIGVHSTVWHVMLAGEATWYPEVHRSERYDFTYDRAPQATMQTAVRGNGFSARTSAAVAVSKYTALTVGWRFRQFSDQGTKLFGNPRVPEQRSLHIVTIGFSVAL